VRWPRQSTHDQLLEAPHESRRQVSAPPFLKRTMPDSLPEESEQIKEPDDPVPGTGPRVDAESSQNQPQASSARDKTPPGKRLPTHKKPRRSDPPADTAATDLATPPTPQHSSNAPFAEPPHPEETETGKLLWYDHRELWLWCTLTGRVGGFLRYGPKCVPGNDYRKRGRSFGHRTEFPFREGSAWCGRAAGPKRLVQCRVLEPVSLAAHNGGVVVMEAFWDHIEAAG
jgi:hypothetical protein